MSDDAWFAGIDIADVEAGARRIRQGRADAPGPWPATALEAGVVPDEETYYEHLGAASRRAVETELAALAGAADRELVQLVRTLEATRSIEHELRQRVGEALSETSPAEVDAADPADLAAALPGDDGVLDRRLTGVLGVSDDLRTERDALERAVDRLAAEVAPNLTALAGPTLAARLIAAAGSLERLAKLPSSTVQVLGAESALFAHLRGEAPSPKHGLIYTHPALRGADAADRGSVARALAGKFTIAARIDHYRGEYEPSLEADLEERLRQIDGGA